MNFVRHWTNKKFPIYHLNELDTLQTPPKVPENVGKEMKEKEDLSGGSEVVISSIADPTNVFSSNTNSKRKRFGALQKSHCSTMKMQRVYFSYPSGQQSKFIFQISNKK